MSTASHSPHYIDHRSPAHAAFNTQAVEDPYLAAPYDPEDELSSTSFDLSSPAVSYHENNITRPSPPATVSSASGQDAHFVSTSSGLGIQSESSNAYAGGLPSAAVDFPSPTDNLGDPLSETSGHLPLSDQSQEAFGSLTLDPWDSFGNSEQKQAVVGQHQIPQLLSPDLTNNHSPSSDFAAVASAPVPLVETGALSNQLPTVNLPNSTKMTSYHPNINTRGRAVSAGQSNLNHAPSPIFKIDMYSRGDSPPREYDHSRRRSSTQYLAPSNSSEESSESLDAPGAPQNKRSMHDYHGSSTRAEDGSWLRNPSTGHAGLDPTSRNDAWTVSPNQVERTRLLNERNAEIAQWVQGQSQAYSRGRLVAGSRRRARSAGAMSTQDYFSPQPTDWMDDTRHIPGPGVLINVPSADGMSEVDAPPSTPSSLASVADGDEPSLVNASPPRESFHRPGPWKDQSLFPDFASRRSQPATAREAMATFDALALEIDGASRVATWGTKPMTDAEVNSIVESNALLRKLDPSGEILRKLTKIWPRGGGRGDGQNLLKKAMPRSADQSPTTPSFKENALERVEEKESKSKGPQRSFSVGRVKSSTKSTGSVMAAAMAASVLGSVGGPVQVQATTSPVQQASSQFGPSKSTREKRGRDRSVSELPPYTRPSMAQLTTRPEIEPPATASPLPRPATRERIRNDAKDNIDDEEDDTEEAAGFDMDFSPSKIPPVPTLDGFREQVKQLNPRIHPELIDRFAKEQVRRYKELQAKKSNHANAVNRRDCPSSTRCFALGGRANLLPARQNPRDSASTYATFRIGNHEELEDAHHAEATAPASFPPGVPNPPVSQLPAQFECQLCFQVKKLHKPSDWTKHVHEDVQPFTCTFPGCTEPKSFARKADCVRHENEKHRQLEWWMCNIEDCRHICYRNHNFVQHLVREHKMTDPKEKKSKTLDPRAKEERERQVAAVWKLVNDCRQETTKKPEEEACRFCGNYCSDWKKLMIHLANHMLQIALPILPLLNVKATDRPLTTNASLPVHSLPSETAPLYDSNLGPTNTGHPTTPGEAQAVFEGNPQAMYQGSQSPIASSFPTSAFYSDQISTQAAPDPGQVNSHLSPYAQQDARPHHFAYISPTHQNTVSYPGPYNALPHQPAMNNPNTQYITSLGNSEGTSNYYPPQGLFESPTVEKTYEQSMSYHSNQMTYEPTSMAEEDPSPAAYVPYIDDQTQSNYPQF